MISVVINLNACAVELADHCYGLQFLTFLTNSKVNCKLLDAFISEYIFHRANISKFEPICHQGLKKPKLFWISAAAPLTSVVLSTLSVFIFRTSVSEISQVRIIIHY